MATNNSIKFCRVDGIVYEDLITGAIYFDTISGTIHVATSNTTTDKFGGDVSDVNWNDETSSLSITKHDGTIISLDFSDMASASAVTSALNLKADKEELSLRNVGIRAVDDTDIEDPESIVTMEIMNKAIDNAISSAITNVLNTPV